MVMRVRRAAALLLVSGLVAGLAVGCTRKESSGPGTAERGSITIKGSDTMVHLVTAWAEAYREQHPDAKIAVTGGGSGTGIMAMINATTDLCMASRKVKQKERDQAAERKVSFTEFEVCLDGIAVVVNPNNPVSELTMDQLRKIFNGSITRWSGVGGPDEPIQVLSRESNSGTYVFFRDHVLKKDDYAQSARLLPATASIVQSVRQDAWSIGYVGLGYLQGDDLKPIGVKMGEGSAAVKPSLDTVRDKSYAIARPLHLYAPGTPAGLAKAFIDFCVGKAGQQVVVANGYVPLVDVDTP
jgi:phosphate transport system substrate-binding protein